MMAVACLAACGTVSGQAPEPGAGAPVPKLVCAAPLYAFGEVPNTVPIEHTFTLRNAGRAPLTIREVRRSCGCTEAALARKNLPPGEQTTLLVTLDLTGRTGEQNRKIYVDSNDPSTPRYTLALVGRAYSEIEVRPERVRFGDVAPDQTVEASVALNVRVGVTATVTQVFWEASYLAVTLEPAPELPGYRFRVGTLPPLPTGYLYDVVKVRTDHPHYSTIAVPVTLRVVGELYVTPTRIMLDAGQPDPVTRSIAVRAGKLKEFDVLSVQPPSPAVQVQLIKAGPASYRVLLRNLSAADSALHGSHVRIRTTAGKMPEIIVPILVR